MKKPSVKSPTPIPLTDMEFAIMAPYLRQAASAANAFKSAQEALDAITRTVSGRAGAAPDQRFKLDVEGKRLVPVGTVGGTSPS